MKSFQQQQEIGAVGDWLGRNKKNPMKTGEQRRRRHHPQVWGMAPRGSVPLQVQAKTQPLLQKATPGLSRWQRHFWGTSLVEPAVNLPSGGLGKEPCFITCYQVTCLWDSSPGGASPTELLWSPTRGPLGSRWCQALQEPVTGEAGHWKSKKVGKTFTGDSEPFTGTQSQRNSGLKLPGEGAHWS